ncbi:MAG: hypothetical protein M1824_003340 [Vezdaea acicularis]|nr:MAG: hypothetical protein M1824_003340 [Vezdaea acicularis]
MPAGRPRLHRTREEALEAQRASKRLHARRLRNKRARHESNSTPPSTVAEVAVSRAPLDLVPAHAVEPAIARVLDLELIHHFTTETCFTLSDQSRAHPVWQVVVPKEGFAHPFLLRGILALSALHLAFLRPENAHLYEMEATIHQDAALGFFRTAMANVTPTNCDAVFAFSSILVLLAFASPKPRGILVLVDAKLSGTEWFGLVRGSRPLRAKIWDWLEAGAMAPMCVIEQVENINFSGTGATKHLSAFLRYCDESEDEPFVKAACALAIEDLEVCFARLASKNATASKVNSVIAWPNGLTQGYMSLLEQKHPKALVILAFYSLALRYIDSYWWVKGWPAHILSTVHQLVDDSMQPWLEWPSQGIGTDETR